MTGNEYTDLVAGYHTEQPKFKSWIYELTEPVRQSRLALAEMPTRTFDIDTASGYALDCVGERVGFQRGVPINIDGLYFAYDDVDGIGFDKGIWYVNGEPLNGIKQLDDETYRACLKTKVMLNHWDGTAVALAQIVRKLFEAFEAPAGSWSLTEGLMSYTLRVRRDAVSAMLWGLLDKRIISFCPAGVTFNLEEMK